MMKRAKRLLLILVLAVLMGCPVVSKNMVGLPKITS